MVEESLPEPHLNAGSVDRDSVRKVAQRVQLEEVRLVTLHAQIWCDASDIPAEWERAVFIGHDAHGSWDEGSDHFSAHIFFIAEYGEEEPEAAEEGDAAEEDPKPPMVGVQATYQLVYRLLDPAGVSQRDIDHFAFQNGTFNAWPYWREVAQSSTQKMGIHPLTIPVFTVQPIETQRGSDIRPEQIQNA